MNNCIDSLTTSLNKLKIKNGIGKAKETVSITGFSNNGNK